MSPLLLFSLSPAFCVLRHVPLPAEYNSALHFAPFTLSFVIRLFVIRYSSFSQSLSLTIPFPDSARSSAKGMPSAQTLAGLTKSLNLLSLGLNLNLNLNLSPFHRLCHSHSHKVTKSPHPVPSTQHPATSPSAS